MHALPALQLNLFRDPPDILTWVAIRIGVREDELVGWYNIGFLSFDPRDVKRFERWMLQEAVFIRDLVRTELSINTVRRMLADLERPYAYRHSEMFFDFAEGRWRSRFEAPVVAQALATSPERAGELARGLIGILARTEQYEELRQIQQVIDRSLRGTDWESQ